jgi:hypothetical protein
MQLIARIDYLDHRCRRWQRYAARKTSSIVVVVVGTKARINLGCPTRAFGALKEDYRSSAPGRTGLG